MSPLRTRGTISLANGLRSFRFYYAGAVMLLALILGGGTAQGLWTDHLLQILMLPALFLGLGCFPETRLSPATKLLAILILLLLLAQFLPFWRPLPMQDLLGSADVVLLSPAPQRSLESAIFALSILGFFLYLARFGNAEQRACLCFLLIGFAVNLAVGIIQLSYGRLEVGSSSLPFAPAAGFFTNENHFSSLIYVMIPLLAYQFLAKYRHVALYLVIAALLVGFLFAVGSRAGMVIAATLSLLSLVWFSPKRLSLSLKLCMLAVWIASIIAVSLSLGFGAVLTNDLRLVFFTTTWKALADHMPFGGGLGTFTLIYPAYEAREDIVDAHANHAHNDLLELLLETGLAGMALAVFFFFLVARRFYRSRLTEAAFIAILALCLHSLIDYPLRTMGLGVVFAWLCAIILSTETAGKVEKREESQAMSARL